MFVVWGTSGAISRKGAASLSMNPTVASVVYRCQSTVRPWMAVSPWGAPGGSISSQLRYVWLQKAVQ